MSSKGRDSGGGDPRDGAWGSLVDGGDLGGERRRWLGDVGDLGGERKNRLGDVGDLGGERKSRLGDVGDLGGERRNLLGDSHGGSSSCLGDDGPGCK